LEIQATEKMSPREQSSITRKVKQRKERENTKFNEVRQLPTSSRQEERVLIESINYRLYMLQIFGDTSPLYITKETTQKKKTKNT